MNVKKEDACEIEGVKMRGEAEGRRGEGYRERAFNGVIALGCETSEKLYRNDLCIAGDMDARET